MDKLDDYTYNHLSDHLTDLEDDRREMRVARIRLIEEGRRQYADSLFLTKLAKMDAGIASVRQALRLIAVELDGQRLDALTAGYPGFKE